MQILQMQKMQKLFCINTKNNAKTRENTRPRSRAENGRKSVKKWQKNGKNATTASGANDEQIRTNGKNARRKLLLYIDLVQVYNLQCKKCKCRFCIVLHCRIMQMQNLQPVCTMYMYLIMYLYMIMYMIMYLYLNMITVVIYKEYAPSA